MLLNARDTSFGMSSSSPETSLRGTSSMLGVAYLLMSSVSWCASASHAISSCVISPVPMTYPPSTCPRSECGFSGLPASSSTLACRIFQSPVSTSSSTSTAAEPYPQYSPVGPVAGPGW